MIRRMTRPRSKIPGLALRLLREARGMHAKDVATVSGWSASYVSDLELDKRTLTPGAIERLAPAFGMTAGELKADLEIRAASLGGPLPAENAERHRRIHGEPSSVLHESPPRYGMPMKSPNPDSDVLLRHLIANMSREQMFALLNSFMKEAEAGDLAAFAKARALFDLIPHEAVTAAHHGSG